MLKIIFRNGASCRTQVLDELSVSADVELDLSDNPLGKYSQSDLIEMIDALTDHHIESLDLSTTLLHLKTTNELIEFFRALNRAGIKKVNLSKNLLGKADSEINLLSVMGAFQDSAVEEINLSSNELGSLSHLIFSKLLQTLAKSPLSRIIFDSNHLSLIGGPYHLADLFHHTLRSKLVLDSPERFTVTIKDRLAQLNASNEPISVSSTNDILDGTVMR